MPPKNTKKIKPVAGKEIVKLQTKVESIIKTPADITVMAKFFADSKMFPELKTIAQNFVVIEAGRELGIQAVMAGQTIHFINNRDLAIESKVLAAIALDNGIRWKILRKDPEGCKLEFYKPGSNIPPHIETFTIEDAERANLTGKKNWQWYPEEMNYNRCFAKGIRVFDPRIGLGFYTKEEADDFVVREEMGEDVKEAEIVSEERAGAQDDQQEREEETQDAEEVEEEEEGEAETYEPEQPEEKPPPPSPELDPGDKPTAEAQQKVDKEADEKVKKLEQNIKTVVDYLAIQKLDYPLFKEFIFFFQASRAPVREMVGRNVHGHLSLHNGKADDIQIMVDNLKWTIDEFIKWCFNVKKMKRAGFFPNPAFEKQED